MDCGDCGTEIPKGGYYCTCCGRPIGFQPDVAHTDEADAGLDDVPEPATSLDAAPAVKLSEDSPYRARVTGKGLCSMCMGAFPETVLTLVDGKPFCPDCSPTVGQRRDPEVETVREPEPVLGQSPSDSLLNHPESSPHSGAKVLIAIAVLLVLGGFGVVAWKMMDGDRIDVLMSDLDTSRKDAYQLAQSYLPGETLEYEVSVEIKATGELAGGVVVANSGELEIKGHVLGGVTMDVLKVDDEGNADLSMTTRDFDMDFQLSVDGKPLSLPGGVGGMDGLKELEGKTIVVRVDPYGKPLDGAANADMPEFMTGQFGDVPRGYLQVGDTWSASMPFQAPPGVNTAMLSGLTNISFDVRYEVEGFKRYAGRDCMVISMKGGLKGADNIKIPMVDDLKCEVGLKGVFLYDVSVGRLVKIAADITVDFGVASSMVGFEVDVLMEMDVDLK